MLTNKNFLNIAYEIVTGSKCVSRHTWAVIVKDNRILSTGYNWTPAWYTNCTDFWNWEKNEKHHEWTELEDFLKSTGVDIEQIKD